MAHMIPAEPKEFDARSHEGIVFEALKKLPDSYYVFHSVGATEGIRTPGTWRRRTTTRRRKQTRKRKFCWFCTFTAKTRKSPLLVVTTGFFGILICDCTVVVKWWSKSKYGKCRN